MPTYPYSKSEDCAVVAPGDFARICSISGVLSSAVDGSVGATWDDRWLLTGPACKFTTQGVVAGDVLHVALPTRPNLRTDQGLVFAVGSIVSETQLRFRPLRRAQGQGNPPRAASATGIIFEVLSADPWIRDAATWLDSRLRRIPGVSDTVPATIFPDDHYRQVSAIKAIADMYHYAARNTSIISDADDSKGDFYEKRADDWMAGVEADYVATVGASAAALGLGSRRPAIADLDEAPGRVPSTPWEPIYHQPGTPTWGSPLS